MRLKLFILVVGLIFGGDVIAEKLPETFNPWLDSNISNEKESENDQQFRNLISKFPRNGYFPSDSRAERLKMAERLQNLAVKGDVRAKLILLAQFSPMDLKSPPSGNPEIIEAFDRVDSSKDMKLMYEVGKLMQLRYSLCVNMYEDSGMRVGENRCQESYDAKKTDFLQQKLRARMIDYFLQSAKMGYPPAQYEVGYLLLENAAYKYGPALKLLDAPHKPAKEWLSLSARSGNNQAKYLLGKITEEKEKSQMRVAAEKKERLEREAASEKSKPLCLEIIFTGIAANYPEDIHTVNKSENITDLLSSHPLVCETVSGGRNFNGAIMDPYSRTRCRGIAFFENHKATIMRWTPDMYHVSTKVDFDTGRMPLALWINRSSASCL